jgi:hypothetical protein
MGKRFVKEPLVFVLDPLAVAGYSDDQIQRGLNLWRERHPASPIHEMLAIDISIAEVMITVA